MAGQSIGDRIVAAQHTIIGSDMSKSVCKATTSEIMGPKKKHLDYLHSLTNELNINIPELADILVDRSKQLKWVIVFKSLITTHHLMCFGNEKFIQHLASRNSLFSLTNFLDKTGVQGYDMSTYIRRYSAYLNEKAISYRTVAYDFIRIRRGKDGFFRTMEGDKLLKALPVLQQLLDALLEFNASPNELTNGVINAAFMLIFKDLIRLFACYNEGVINLLEKYFTMKKNQCKEALDAYKKFLTRMTKVSEMLKVAEEVGIDKGDIPDLTTAPNSLLDALEQHLASLEGKKTDSKHVASADAHMSTLNALNQSLQKIDESSQQTALDEEKIRLETYKKQREKEVKQQQQIPAPAVTASQQQPTTSSASSDLLDIFAAPAASSTLPSGNFAFPQAATAAPVQQQQPFGLNQQQPQGFGIGVQPTQQLGVNTAQTWAPSQTPNTSSNLFGFEPASQPVQANLFANSPFQNTNADNEPQLAAAGLLQPTRPGQEQPLTAQLPAQTQVNDGKDLESSLASVVANLTVTGQKPNRDFEPKTEKKLTGGVNFTPNLTPSPLTYNSSPIHGMAPGIVPVAQQGMPIYGGGMMVNNTMVPMQQPQQQQQPAYGMQFQQPYQQPPVRNMNPNNPFGSM